MKSKQRYGLLFITPGLFLVFVFIIFAIFYALFISFTDMELSGLVDFSNVNFIGVDNYTKILQDDEFINALKNTLFYVVVGVPLLVTISFSFALLISLLSTKIGAIFKTIYYLPAVTTIIAVAFVWATMYNYQYGILNFVINKLGGDSVAWLTDPLYAKFSVIFLGVWRGIGGSMIIFLAALINVPKQLYEASEIDGANFFHKLFHITIPSIKFAFFFVIVTSIIAWLQFFDEVFVLTKGGPVGGTESISFFIYREGIKSNQYGFASAASIIMFTIIFGVTVVQMIINKKRSDRI